MSVPTRDILRLFQAYVTRPENIVVQETAGGARPENGLDVRVGWMEFLGSFFRAELEAGALGAGRTLVADFSVNLVGRTGLREGASATVALPRERLRVYPGADGDAG